jgi:hypothetical protein
MSRFIPSFISSMFGSGSAEDKPVQPISIDPTYICPLSGQIMTDPVIASNGLTYDRSSIHSYFATFQPDQEIISPSDALAKIERNVFPNIMLKEQIRKYRETIEPTSLVTISHSMSNTIIPNDGTNSKTLVLTIDPTPKAISNKPVGNDIVFVLDVSGSMATGVVALDAANGESGYQLSRLDLVKHATLATSKMLGANDNMCIVTYSTTSKVALDFTPMNDHGKSLAANVIKAIHEESSTEFCPAIKCVFDAIHQKSAPGRHVSILFLTDGEASDNPTTIMTALEHQMLNITNTTLSTFIFGTNANSNLLKRMSETGQGMYSFIPDASMIGTVFSNFIANVKDTVIPCAKLTIDTFSGCHVGISRSVNVIHNIHSRTPKNICYQLTINDDQKTQPFEIAITVDINNIKHTYKITSTEDTNVQQVAIQNMRLKFIRDIAMAADSITSIAVSQKIIDDLRMNIKTMLTTYPSNPFLDGMLRDLESSNPDEAQLTKAFSQMGWRDSWGRHYALSVIRANMLEETSNYKTPSIAPYANIEFERIRDLADATFVSLPPPEPSIKPVGRSTYVPSANAANNLAANFYGGCVSSESLVDTTRGSVNISCLKKGDQVVHSQGFSTVLCVVEHFVGVEEVDFVVMGANQQLKITNWHPIRSSNTTEPVFPVECHNIKTVVENPTRVFNLVMIPGDTPWYRIDDVECVSVGHGQMDDPVLRHPYYASKIVDDLKGLNGWEDGYVVMHGKKVRDTNTGLVSGYM